MTTPKTTSEALERARKAVYGRYGADEAEINVGVICELIALAESALHPTGDLEGGGLSCESCREWIAANNRGGWIDQLRNKAEALEIRLAEAQATHLPATAGAEPKCRTCEDHGIVGFPPHESLCPDCSPNDAALNHAYAEGRKDEAEAIDNACVDRLAAAMKAKLADARAKGRGGWQEPGLHQHLSGLLREHVEKGDPRDVANFCAFLWSRGESIAPLADSAKPAGEPVAWRYRHRGGEWEYSGSSLVADNAGNYEVEPLYLAAAPAPTEPAAPVLTDGPWTPTYYVRHPDDSYSVADPQPIQRGNEKDERAAFEAWIAKDGGDLSTFGSGRNVHYSNSAVNNAWGGWLKRSAISTPATKPEPASAQCPNCLGTFAPSMLDPEWKGRCMCKEPASAPSEGVKPTFEECEARMERIRAIAEKYASWDRETVVFTGWQWGMFLGDVATEADLAPTSPALQESKGVTEAIMKLADRYAHVYSFVGDDTMPKARKELEVAVLALAGGKRGGE